MSPKQADKRITLSRQTLALYSRMPIAPEPLEANLKMLTDEIATLEGIAAHYSDKATKIASLIGNWRDYQARLKRNAH